MFTKDRFNFLLTTVLMCCLGLCVTSCKDDGDDDRNNGTTTQVRDDADPMDTEQVEVATRWISALTSTDVLSTGWEQQTYEPTLGRTSQNNALTRLVVVNDLDEARAEFASMANVEPKDLGNTKTVAMEGVGSLTWNLSAEGAENLATVDVDIRQVPHLQKIVYCTEEQTGSNGIFSKNVTGTAYYRFGDVVRDHQGYYWVCVRPSFEISDKGESHWVNIFNAAQEGNQKPILTKYIESKYDNKAKYKNQTLLLPTKLESDRKHIHNLSNLVWLLLDPSKYATYAANNGGKGLGGFPYEYNGTEFVKKVAQFWGDAADRGYNIWKLLFGYDVTDLKKVERLNFFYKGYSWKWGDNITFWDYRTTGYNPEYFGNDDQDEVKMPWADGFDVNLLAGSSNAKTGLGSGQARIATINGHKEGKWLVRVVTGDKLCLNGNYDPYNKLSDCDDIYRFNDRMNVQSGSKLQKDDEIKNKQDVSVNALAAPAVGCIMGADGRFYSNVEDANKGAGAMALVVCLNGNTPVEDGTSYNGLAMAIDDIEDVAWGEQNIDCGLLYADNFIKMTKRLDGLAVTKKLADGCGKNHSHPAATQCANYDGHETAALRQNGNVSQWFMPSTGQWILAMKALGLSWDDNKGYGYDYGKVQQEKEEREQLRLRIKNVGLTYQNNFDELSYTTTPYRSNTVHVMGFVYQLILDDPMTNGCQTKHKVRPFIAFKYQN